MEAASPSSFEQRRLAPPVFLKLGRLVRRRPAFVLGLLIIFVYVIVALIGPQLTPYGPTETNPRAT